MAIENHNLKFTVSNYVKCDKHNLHVNTALLSDI